jgi:hypothetical protein
MHAVPRPTLAYLDPSEGGSNDVLWTRKRKKADGSCDESTIYKRSVLLFNTWSCPAICAPALGLTTTSTLLCKLPPLGA